MPEADSKYGLFRNYMVNELGITRDDIERWTKEAVAVEVTKLVGHMNIEGLASRTIDQALKAGYGQGVSAQVARMLVDRLSVSVRDKSPAAEDGETR